MSNFFFSILLTGVLLSCANHGDQPNAGNSSNGQQEHSDPGVDFIDAYKLSIGKTFLFGNYEHFITDMGLPAKLTITKTDIAINSRADLDKAVSTLKEPQIATLHYPGIDMWYAYDNYIIPSSIDFRKTVKTVNYGTTSFDTSYTTDDFKKQFPNSAKSAIAIPPSLFEITTKEVGENFKHFILMRKTKDDPNATPMIEFTFDNDKLIFILFANY